MLPQITNTVWYKHVALKFDFQWVNMLFLYFNI